ncbi:hypothetical protein B0H21DRAFT_744749 [Amylocystis lapponica]|nr:hypothetical protein B0H21DRAFT_744749 [Amylocystis lapponica]
MHRCLHVTEIARNVSEQAFNNVDDRYRTKTVASLSETCRKFHLVAREFLWSRLSSLGPLIKCMPDDIWKEASTDVRLEASVDLINIPLPSDWQRFQLYAGFVKLLTIDDRFRALCHHDEDTFRRLSITRPHGGFPTSGSYTGMGKARYMNTQPCSWSPLSRIWN